METSPSSLWRLVGEAPVIIFRAAPGFEARLTPHGSLALTGEPVADLNFALVDRGPDPESWLRELMGRVRERDDPVLVLLADRVADALAPVAAELGLEHAGRMPLMACRPQEASAGSGRFSVERVASEQDLRAAVGLAAEAFGLPLDSVQRVFGPNALEGPGFDYFLARADDGSPVSSGATTRHGPAVGIWMMATPPQHQRMGAGRAVLKHAMAHHLSAGAELFYLGATEAGLPLYERTGFRTVAEADVWVRGHSTQALARDDEG